MGYKVASIFLIFAINILPVFIKNSYSQPKNELIYPDEISRTLEDVMQKPTTQETFTYKIKVLEAWHMLSISSGKEDELRQTVPPEVLQNIIRLKKEGDNSKAFNLLDNVFSKMKLIGLPEVPSTKPLKRLNNKSPKQPTSAITAAEVAVDYSKTMGIFSPYLFGTIAAPWFDQKGFDLSKEAGFKMIVIHEKVRVPEDLNDPSQYNFTRLDKSVEAAIKNGLSPMICFLAGSKEELPDLARFATYVEKVAKHLTQGWGNGYKWDIKLFSFISEPDNLGSWAGTQLQYFEAYASWAKALKAVDSKFIIVAPSLMFIKVGEHLSPWAIRFLEYCKKNNVPVDIFSFHAYSSVVYYDFYANFKSVQAELKKYPNLSPLYGTPQLANDEWNIMPGDLWSNSYRKQFDISWVAAQNIIALTAMIDSELNLSVRYGGPFNGGFGGCHDFLLTDCNHQGKPSYYAFKGFNWLAGKNHLLTTGSDYMNFSSLAGKDKDEVVIVISNYDTHKYLIKYQSAEPIETMESSVFSYDKYSTEFNEPKRYNKFNLKLNNLPWNASQQIKYDRYLVDDKHNLELVESKTVAGDKTLFFTGEMTAPSVHIIKVSLK